MSELNFAVRNRSKMMTDRAPALAAQGTDAGAVYFAPENAMLVELYAALSEREFEVRWIGINPVRSSREPQPDAAAGQRAFGHAAVALRRVSDMALTGIAWPARVSNTLLLWLERYRQRRALDALGDHVLKDIGLSRSAVDREVMKRFWRG